MTKPNQPVVGRTGKGTKKLGKKRRHRRSDSDRNKIGRWEKWEHQAFLDGLTIHGKGKWKLISKMIPTRTTVQVKTHAQMYLKTMESNKDKRALLSTSFSSSDVDDMTASTKDSSQSNRSLCIPVVITVEHAIIPPNDTPRLKNAAYILATLNETFVQRNERGR